MTDPEDQIEEDIGGVQGEDPRREPTDTDGDVANMGVDVQAPDAGEIEWAGELVKKAPGSAPE